MKTITQAYQALLDAIRADFHIAASDSECARLFADALGVVSPDDAEMQQAAQTLSAVALSIAGELEPN